MGSSAGQGSVSFSPKNEPAGPPFPAGSANNGLSVDSGTGAIVLGDDMGGVLSQFLNSRYLDVNSNSFNIYDGINGQFTIDPIGQVIRLGDFTNAVLPYLEIDNFGNRFRVIEGLAKFDLDKGLGTYRIGDLEAEQNGTLISIDDTTENIIAAGSGIVGLNLDFFSDLYSFGDTANTGFGTKIVIDNTAPNITFQGLGITGLNIDMDSNVYEIGDANGGALGSKLRIEDVNEQANLILGFNNWLESSNTTGYINIGDIDAAANGSVLTVDDANEIIRTNFANNANAGFFLRPTDNFYEFGDRTTRTAFLELKGADLLAVVALDNVSALKLDKQNQTYNIGDIDNADNGTYLNVDDFNNKFIFQNAALTSLININGVDGFTGTVTPVTSITVNGGIVTDVT